MHMYMYKNRGDPWEGQELSSAGIPARLFQACQLYTVLILLMQIHTYSTVHVHVYLSTEKTRAILPTALILFLITSFLWARLLASSVQYKNRHITRHYKVYKLYALLERNYAISDSAFHSIMRQFLLNFSTCTCIYVDSQCKGNVLWNCCLHAAQQYIQYNMISGEM